ncbi:hypothetical protein Ddc_12718 [Ditylenchus destructor]|nr:hypothetical protein Ddc_12718 [Ditylenchus destructor]
MYTLKKRFPAVKSNGNSQASSTSGEQRPSKLFCYVDECVLEKTYFVYWICDSNTLGVTDLDGAVYEKVMDKKDRKKVLKNVAESMVDVKWKSIFNAKGFKLGNVTEDCAQIRYISEIVELSLVNIHEERVTKNATLLKAALQEIRDLTCLLEKQKTSPERTKESQSSGQELQSSQRSSQQQVSVPLSNMSNRLQRNGRKRGMPTGVVFDDEEEN